MKFSFEDSVVPRVITALVVFLGSIHPFEDSVVPRVITALVVQVFLGSIHPFEDSAVLHFLNKKDRQ